MHTAHNSIIRPLIDFCPAPAMGARQAYTATVHALWFKGVVPTQTASYPLGDRGGWLIR